MKAEISAVLLALLAAFVSAFAQNASSVWEKKGLEITARESENGRDSLTLKDAGGRIFGVRQSREPDEQTAGRILGFVDSFTNWKSAGFASMDFLIDENSLEIHLIPSRFACGDRDVLSNLPAGLIFSAGETVEYHFRITTGNLFIRVSGIFKDEDELCNRIITTLDNPTSHAGRDDIAILADRIDVLEKKYEAALKKINDAELSDRRTKEALIGELNRSFFGTPQPISREIIDRILSLRTAEPQMGRRQLLDKLKSENRLISEKELGIVLNVFYGE